MQAQSNAPRGPGIGAVHWSRPLSGPCLGHLCDECTICRGGHCCRRDDPEYRLPEVGTWPGVVYGQLGSLDDDGQKVCCHVCGEHYKALALHLWQRHDLTAAEYRAYFGLNRRHALMSLAVRRRLAECLEHTVAIGHLAADGHQRIALAQAAIKAMTPEQLLSWSQRAHRLETRIREGQVRMACVICGAVRLTTAALVRNRTVVTCGAPSCRRAYQSQVHVGMTASLETRRRISRALSGKPKSAEWRSRLSEAQKRLLATDPAAQRRRDGATVAAAFINRKALVAVRCLCGEDFWIKPGRVKYRRFCSIRCAARHRGTAHDPLTGRFLATRTYAPA